MMSLYNYIELQNDCDRRDHVQYLTVSKNDSDNYTCSSAEQNSTFKKPILRSETNVKQNTIFKIAIRFC